MYIRTDSFLLMRRLSVLQFIILFFCIGTVNSFAQTPVLLRVVSSEQSDTLGCNFVKELTRIIYNEITSSRVKLWDSPAKEIQITGATLLEIERSTETKFIDQEVIFVYEYWTHSGKILKSVTQGFSFSQKNKAGEDVSYGYIDYKDVQDAFLGVRVNSNANGTFSASISNYINTKEYAYDILQFNGEVVSGVKESQKIKTDFIGTNQFNPSYFTAIEIPQKLVTYSINFANSIESKKLLGGKQLANAIQNYLIENTEVFYNLGGDQVISHLQQKKWSITNLIVKEIWKKSNNEISYAPVSILIYVNDSALSEIPYRDMVKMDIQVNGVSWIELLKEKNFQLMITRINAQDIARTEAYLYLKAFQNAEWNKLTKYVAANNKY